MQLGEEADQVLQAPAQPIHGPGHHHVELALSRVSAQRIKRRALVSALGAANPVNGILGDRQHVVGLQRDPTVAVEPDGGKVDGVAGSR